MKEQRLFKILIGGDAAVGKTTLLYRYVDGIFKNDTTMTVGVEVRVKEVELESTKCQLQLWDLGGQQRFRFLMSNYVPGANGGVVLFDTTSMSSFVNIKKWTQLFRHKNKSLPIILVATKCDLEAYSIVKDYYANLKRKQLNMLDYIKTSAKTGLNVDTVFKSLAQTLIDNEKKGKKRKSLSKRD
ncbi:MAG: Rab family GTPase [Promethearchaeia archaeon]